MLDASEGKWPEARAALDRASALGLPKTAYDDLQKQFDAATPYHYSSYDEETEVVPSGAKHWRLRYVKPNGKPGVMPLMRVASHRARVTKAHQQKLLERIKRCWDAIETGHIFTELSREENDSRCELFDETAASLATGGKDDWFNQVTRPKLW
jgi:hypothetical protein